MAKHGGGKAGEGRAQNFGGGTGRGNEGGHKSSAGGNDTARRAPKAHKRRRR